MFITITFFYYYYYFYYSLLLHHHSLSLSLFPPPFLSTFLFWFSSTAVSLEENKTKINKKRIVPYCPLQFSSIVLFLPFFFHPHTYTLAPLLSLSLLRYICVLLLLNLLSVLMKTKKKKWKFSKECTMHTKKSTKLKLKEK